YSPGDDYIAVSHVWGQTLKVSSGTPLIPWSLPLSASVGTLAKLKAALVKILGVGKWGWLDIVCIKQENASPKEQQAQLRVMGKVYLEARSVYVWDKEPRLCRCVALRIMRSAEGLGRLGVSGIQRVEIIEHALSRSTVVGGTVAPQGEQGGGGEVMKTALEMDWWTRVWTWQEGALAKRIKIVARWCEGDCRLTIPEKYADCGYWYRFGIKGGSGSEEAMLRGPYQRVFNDLHKMAYIPDSRLTKAMGDMIIDSQRKEIPVSTSKSTSSDPLDLMQERILMFLAGQEIPKTPFHTDLPFNPEKPNPCGCPITDDVVKWINRSTRSCSWPNDLVLGAIGSLGWYRPPADPYGVSLQFLLADLEAQAMGKGGISIDSKVPRFLFDSSDDHGLLTAWSHVGLAGGPLCMKDVWGVFRGCWGNIWSPPSPCKSLTKHNSPPKRFTSVIKTRILNTIAQGPRETARFLSTKARTITQIRAFTLAINDISNVEQIFRELEAVDPVPAILKLVTNSDFAYVSNPLAHASQKKQNAAIQIRVVSLHLAGIQTSAPETAVLVYNTHMRDEFEKGGGRDFWIDHGMFHDGVTILCRSGHATTKALAGTGTEGTTEGVGVSGAVPPRHWRLLEPVALCWVMDTEETLNSQKHLERMQVLMKEQE
ncbi:hypothetical protein HK102_006348, partial [Quaeritorhiza haematococci]